MMRIKAYIAGIGSTVLSEAERALFSAHMPWGFILFARNISDPMQVRSLTASLRELTGRADTPILIDQEGGRVARLRPPHWPSYPPGRAFGEIHSRDPKAGLRAAWLQSRLMAHDLHALGINVDCLPVLDVPVEGAHDVIGDRAYSHNPKAVARIAAAACKGLLDGGVLPVIKHIPGHGRAFSDSHHALPVVDASMTELAASDFLPFAKLAAQPMAMTAHVVYSALDCDNPATTSKKVIRDIIRGNIGFDGLLMSDDLSMKALSGDFGERTHSAFAAGCDVVLHCNGVMAEMAAIAEACPQLKGAAKKRADGALSKLRSPKAMDETALREEFSRLALMVA